MNRDDYKGSYLFIVFAVVLFLSGCASTSAFRAYTSQINPFIQNLKNNKTVDLNKALAGKETCSDRILYLMERGRLAQIQGDFDTSKKNFELAMQAIKEYDEKAIISASSAVAQVSSVVVNENTIPYKGDGYERVMLYHFQALNYMAKNDIEGAGVEVRRANAEQNDALARHEKEILRVKEEAKKQNVSTEIPSEIAQAYAAMDQAIGGVKSSFQNAYTFYVSGIIYEMLNQPNDAYIDYKKAIEIFPNNIYLQKDVVRLAKKLGMGHDLGIFKHLYPKAFESPPPPKKSGEAVILFDDDFVAQKQQIKIPIPISTQTVNIIAMAFPIYTIPPFNPSRLALSEGKNVLGETKPICNINALALKSLKERVLGIVIRQLIRSVAKAAAAKVAEEKGGKIGSFIASLYNVFSENADLRSWATLPADAQIMRISLPAGEHEFLFSHKDSGATSSIKVNIKESALTILYTVRAGNKLYCRTMP